MDNVGKTIGNYIIVKLCDTKDTSGHKLYDSICTKCGHLIRHKRIIELETTNLGEQCHHCNYDTNWHSKRLRHIFNDMCKRCYNPNCLDYDLYGKRGISICDEWLNDPQTFNDWAVENGYEEGLTIDRISSDGNYCPENCRWVTREENAKFKSTTNLYTVNGITDSGRGWAKRLGFGPNYINKYARNHTKEEVEAFISKLLQKNNIAA